MQIRTTYTTPLDSYKCLMILSRGLRHVHDANVARTEELSCFHDRAQMEFLDGRAVKSSRLKSGGCICKASRTCSTDCGKQI